MKSLLIQAVGMAIVWSCVWSAPTAAQAPHLAVVGPQIQNESGGQSGCMLCRNYYYDLENRWVHWLETFNHSGPTTTLLNCDRGAYCHTNTYYTECYQHHWAEPMCSYTTEVAAAEPGKCLVLAPGTTLTHPETQGDSH
jgi:hypothetical protein